MNESMCMCLIRRCDSPSWLQGPSAPAVPTPMSDIQSYRQLTEYGDLLKNGKCIHAEIPLFN